MSDYSRHTFHPKTDVCVQCGMTALDYLRDPTFDCPHNIPKRDYILPLHTGTVEVRAHKLDQ